MVNQSASFTKADGRLLPISNNLEYIFESFGEIFDFIDKNSNKVTSFIYLKQIKKSVRVRA
jgi:hypothetical protein